MDNQQSNHLTTSQHRDQKLIESLLAFALEHGATRAARLDPDQVLVESRLAAFCRSPKCPHYGLSMSCPPHVSGPAGMRRFLRESRHAIVLRVEVDSDSLNGEDRPELLRLLHEITATIEAEARRLGFQQTRAFAGGSCKASFCPGEKECAVLSGAGTCRNPESARPSLSGFGVNVGELMQAAGWSSSIFSSASPEQDQLSWLAALILLG